MEGSKNLFLKTNWETRFISTFSKCIGRKMINTRKSDMTQTWMNYSKIKSRNVLMIKVHEEGIISRYLVITINDVVFEQCIAYTLLCKLCNIVWMSWKNLQVNVVRLYVNINNYVKPLIQFILDISNEPLGRSLPLINENIYLF